jgi:hypothetical protein
MKPTDIEFRLAQSECWVWGTSPNYNIALFHFLQDGGTYTSTVEAFNDFVNRKSYEANTRMNEYTLAVKAGMEK